jgi:hypothetical protein
MRNTLPTYSWDTWLSLWWVVLDNNIDPALEINIDSIQSPWRLVCETAPLLVVAVPHAPRLGLSCVGYDFLSRRRSGPSPFCDAAVKADSAQARWGPVPDSPTVGWNRPAGPGPGRSSMHSRPQVRSLSASGLKLTLLWACVFGWVYTPVRCPACHVASEIHTGSGLALWAPGRPAPCTDHIGLFGAPGPGWVAATCPLRGSCRVAPRPRTVPAYRRLRRP